MTARYTHRLSTPRSRGNRRRYNGLRWSPALLPSPEAEACRRAFAALLPQLVEMAALSGDLARLHAEYKRTVRRVRALPRTGRKHQLRIHLAHNIHHKIDPAIQGLGIFTIAYIWGGMASYPHYIFIAMIETLCLLLIIWFAWKWRNVEA